ncbi:hypothetical protein [Mycoplasmopsis adleri]
MKNDKKIFCTLVRSKNVHNKIQTPEFPSWSSFLLLFSVLFIYK